MNEEQTLLLKVGGEGGFVEILQIVMAHSFIITINLPIKISCPMIEMKSIKIFIH